MENLEKAVELKIKYLDDKYSSLTTIYHNLATLYKAIQYYYPNTLEY